jgi:hypothetical protein
MRRRYGLAFLLAAVKYPEMQEKYSMFSTEKFKDTGLPYGPKWNAYLIRKKVLSETGEKDKLKKPHYY